MDCFIQGLDEDRRTKYCSRKNVAIKCPRVCNKCCSDDKNFKFINVLGKEKSCRVLQKGQGRRALYCNQKQNGALIRNKCPLSCGICKITSSPSSIPTSVPSHSPTGAPSTSTIPTESPSSSFEPSIVPSQWPSISTSPSVIPTETPISSPSESPSTSTFVLFLYLYF